MQISLRERVALEATECIGLDVATVEFTSGYGFLQCSKFNEVCKQFLRPINDTPQAPSSSCFERLFVESRKPLRVQLCNGEDKQQVPCENKRVKWVKLMIKARTCTKWSCSIIAIDCWAEAVGDSRETVLVLSFCSCASTGDVGPLRIKFKCEVIKQTVTKRRACVADSEALIDSGERNFHRWDFIGDCKKLWIAGHLLGATQK